MSIYFTFSRRWLVSVVMLSVIPGTPLWLLRAQTAPSVVPARPGQAEALARQLAASAGSAARPPGAAHTSAPSAYSGTARSPDRVPAGTLDQTLDRLDLSATDFTRNVKNAVCREEIDSERQSTPGLGPRVLPARVHAVSELQVEVHDGHVEEHRKWVSQDNRSLTAGQAANLPYNLSQAFAVPPSAYLSREHRSCLHFSMQQPGRFNFQATPWAGKGMCADIGPQAVGYILFDPETDLISHIERTVPVAAGAAGAFAPFAAVDYQPTEKNGRSYQLPSRIVATRQNKGYSLRFDARYSCQILGTTIKMTNADGSPVERAH